MCHGHRPHVLVTMRVTGVLVVGLFGAPMASTAARPSLRERLFSTSSKKSGKQSATEPDVQLPVVPDDPDREQGSLSTTLTNNNNNRRVPFYRRKGSASAGALSSSTSHSLVKPPPGPSRSRPSFLSRVVTKVVPCVSAPDTPVGSADNNPPFALKDISKPDPQPELEISPPLAAGFTIPPNPSNPPSPTDSDIVIPPPVSATLLPNDETDGMTSGAVQPPGSLGTTEIVHTHSHDSSSDDSDRTSFTDEEHELHHIHDEQDEEARLKKSGGSGIPIGPVGAPLCPYMVISNVMSRMASQSHSYHPLLLSM